MNGFLSEVVAKYGSPIEEARLIVKCSKSGERFAIIARKESSGWYRAGCEPVRSSGVVAIPAEQFDMTWALANLPCHLCGTGGAQGQTDYVMCGKCGEWVCPGRTVFRFFNCCKSCGGIGMISAREGASALGSRVGNKISQVSTVQSLLTGPTVLRLGNGGRK